MSKVSAQTSTDRLAVGQLTRTYRASLLVTPSADLPHRCLDALRLCHLRLRSLAIGWEQPPSDRQRVSVEVDAPDSSAVRAWANRLCDAAPEVFECTPLTADAPAWAGHAA